MTRTEGATTFLVPAGSEERAVRRAVPRARIAVIRAGAAAARSLPDDLAGDVVLLGLCGALRPLAVGTAVVYAAAVDEAGAIALPAGATGLRTVRGYTAPLVVTRVSERAALADHYDADVVDMEGTHVARALAARGLSCTMVRVVSDGCEADLPPMEHAFNAEGQLQPLVVAAAFAREPAAAARFIADVRRSLRRLSEVARALTAEPA